MRRLIIDLKIISNEGVDEALSLMIQNEAQKIIDGKHYSAEAFENQNEDWIYILTQIHVLMIDKKASALDQVKIKFKILDDSPISILSKGAFMVSAIVFIALALVYTVSWN